MLEFKNGISVYKKGYTMTRIALRIQNKKKMAKRVAVNS